MKKMYVLLFLTLIPILGIQAKVNLVWQANQWEEDWLMELLQGLDYNIIYDGKFEQFVDNSIVIINYVPQFEAYAKRMHDLGYKFGIIHLSDEVYASPTTSYQYAQFILRNHWHKKFLPYDNIVMFPLGYKGGFWNNCSKDRAMDGSRKYTWSFAGQVRSNRAAMMQEMKKITNNYVYQIYRWCDPNSLPVEKYRDFMLNSYFIPCPRGNWNLDSFRVGESLEAGCIPIVEKQPLDYFKKLFGEEYPFLSVNSWGEVPGLINQLLKDPVLLEHKRMECYHWWQNHKKKVSRKFINMIERYLDIS